MVAPQEGPRPGGYLASGSRAVAAIREWLGRAGGESPRARKAPETAITEALALQVRQLEMKVEGLVDSLFSGEYLSVFRGQGLEFSSLREYEVGDDVRAIDWKVTARRGHPYVKQFVEERELTTVVLIDVSASKGFGTGSRSNADLAFELAAILALSATRNNDRVGLLLVSDEVELYIKPGAGRRHSLRLLLEMHAFEPRGRGTRLSRGLDFVARVSHQRAIVFMISDFIVEPAEMDALLRAGRAASVRHDLVPIRIRDSAAEELLPELGMVALIDPETGRRVVVNASDPAFRQDYRTLTAASRAEVTELFRELKVDLVEVSTGESYVPPLLGFFHRRARARR